MLPASPLGSYSRRDTCFRGSAGEGVRCQGCEGDSFGADAVAGQTTGPTSSEAGGETEMRPGGDWCGMGGWTDGLRTNVPWKKGRVLRPERWDQPNVMRMKDGSRCWWWGVVDKGESEEGPGLVVFFSEPRSPRGQASRGRTAESENRKGQVGASGASHLRSPSRGKPRPPADVHADSFPKFEHLPDWPAAQVGSSMEAS